jgi:hypothetical protein
MSRGWWQFSKKKEKGILQFLGPSGPQQQIEMYQHLEPQEVLSRKWAVKNRCSQKPASTILVCSCCTNKSDMISLFFILFYFILLLLLLLKVETQTTHPHLKPCPSPCDTMSPTAE